MQGEFPTRESCDLDDPFEMFLWCFVALPGMKGAPLQMPLEYYRLVSKRLYDLGARLVEQPVLRWRPPIHGTAASLTAQGEWVDADEPETEHDRIAQAIDKMRPEVRREVERRLRERRETEQAAHDIAGEYLAGMEEQ